jgi:5'-3' exonuclease
MGIPYYVSSLLRQHKHIQQNIGNARLQCDIIGLDFNSFIHTYLRPENPVGSVVVALRNLFRDTVTAKKILIAFDGLVPYAKIVQQRYRRMREPEALGTGIQFDKHQISPGTPYMYALEDALRMVFPECEISGTNERGEGEHKIFTWLRTMKPQNRENIVIYGLDADLVLISVAQSSLGNIKLLREKQDGGFSAFSIEALKTALPLPADEWVKMCIKNFGNDFMPTLAMFSLREDGYARALHFKDGAVKEQETKMLISRAKDSDRKIVASDGHALETRFGIHLMDGILDWEKPVYAYWKTYAWTLHYFQTSEVLDWCWFYPYPEAPLVQTLNDYEQPTTFVWEYPEPPFTIADQLAFILPASSLTQLKVPARYPDEIYQEGPDSRPRWMKSYVWETDPYISLPWDPARPLTSVNVNTMDVDL